MGDQLVLVQENSLVGVTYDKAIELIRSCRGAVKLTVNQNSPSSVPAPDTVTTTNQNTPSISQPANHATSATDSAPLSTSTAKHVEEEVEKQPPLESNHVSPSKSITDTVTKSEASEVTG